MSTEAFLVTKKKSEVNKMQNTSSGTKHFNQVVQMPGANTVGIIQISGIIQDSGEIAVNEQNKYSCQS